jgi:hypothetical protein
MIAIILSTCFVNDPTVCQDHQIPLSLEISAIQCKKHAQPYVAQWSDEHPRWRVVRWHRRQTSERDI